MASHRRVLTLGGDDERDRLHAPSPGRREPPKDRSVPPAPAETWDDEDDEPEGEDPLDALIEPSRWPDDEDDPALGGLLEERDLEELQPLDGVGDDGVEDDVDLPIGENVPLDDDLESLDAPDDTEIPILPWTLEARVDGAVVQARVDPGRDQTVWLRQDGHPGERRVVLELAGKRLPVTVLVQLADQPGLLLGRDVLSGRFLLRP